jgi:hypothetical protein
MRVAIPIVKRIKTAPTGNRFSCRSDAQDCCIRFVIVHALFPTAKQFIKQLIIPQGAFFFGSAWARANIQVLRFIE